MVRILLICLVMILPLRAVAEPVVVFAAASLKGALDEIFEGQDVVVSYGGSGAMAQQIAQGAPADIFVSANVAWVEWLQDQGIGVERVDLLSNRLVSIANAAVYRANAGDLTDVAVTDGIALGQTRSVPVGIYARQSLETLGEWDALSGRIIEFPSASAVLRAVELGEVPVGIVYFTDAAQSERIATIDLLDEASHDPILYPSMMLTSEAEEAFGHLQSPEAAEVFGAHGFIVLADQ